MIRASKAITRKPWPKMTAGEKVTALISSGFGAGYSKFAPGTVGAVWGVGIYLLLDSMSLHPVLYAAICVLLVLAAVPVCSRAEAVFGKKDPGEIVFDEIVSVPITMFMIEVNIYWVILGFLLNRAFDIVKIPPAYQAQKLRGGWGVVVDDVVAGVQSNLVMHLTVFVVSVVM